jgi:hypothetical protein
MRTKELNIRGFIEGVEVPIISATITVAPNTPAAAAIQIIATDRAHELKPRSVVHIFFKDLYEGPGASVYVAGEGIETEYHAQKYAQILEEEQYKLLFCGEIMGYQFDKTSSTRQIALQCADFSVYWDTAWYFSGGGFFAPSQLKKKFSLASGGFFEHLLLNKGEMVYKEFTTPPQGFPGVTGLLGGLIHLMQSVGGVYWKGAEKFGGLNPTFSIAELKFHITQQIAAADDDGPKKLLKSKGFGSIWNRSIRGLGKNFTYRMVLNALQKYIFYEVYPCPAARYIPGTGIYDEDDTGAKLLRNHPRYGYFVIAAGQFQKSVNRLITDFVDTRAMTVAEYRSSLKRMNKELKGYITDIDAKDKVRLGKVRKNFIKARGRIKTLLKTLANSLPARGKRYNQILKDLNFIDDKLRAVYGMTVQAVKTKKVTTTKGTKKITKTVEVAKKSEDLGQPPFLMSQLFRPDVWFCAPPRCNVLFPDDYYSLNFGRNYMAEITRLLLRTYSSFFGPDILFDKYYYAPALPGLKGPTAKKGKKAATIVQKSFLKLVDSRRDVMEHELYTGVLPKFERAGSHKVLGLRTGKTLGGGVDVGYAQRLANFLFFKYRYAARQMSVVGPFNPYLVAGFPCVVLDKPIDVDGSIRVRKELERFSDDLSSIKELTGTHYLGLIVGMVHSATQGGGSTSLQLQYARTHREEVEALGADVLDNTVKKAAGKKPVESYVCALRAPVPGERGLYEGTILGVKEIAKGSSVRIKGTENEIVEDSATQSLVTKKKTVYSTPKKFPLLGTHVKRTGKNVKWKKKFDSLVRPWERLPAVEFGPEVVGLVGPPGTAEVEFRLFWIKEDVVRTEEEQVDMPLEDILRPPWYSSIWFNNSIGGAVYNKFFGTTAVTDPLTVVDEFSNVSVPNPDAVAQNAAMSSIKTEEDMKFDLNVILALDHGTSIEAAVDLLAYLYSVMKAGNYDVQEFTRAYSWRPVASMIDMFGTPDLELAYGQYQGDVFVPGTQGESPVVAKQGLEGFHSRAFGDYKDLFGLVGPQVGSIIGVQNQQDPANARLDVRRERWLRVLAYVIELQERGLLG